MIIYSVFFLFIYLLFVLLVESQCRGLCSVGPTCLAVMFYLATFSLKRRRFVEIILKVCWLNYWIFF